MKTKLSRSKQGLAQFLNQEHVAGIICTSPFIFGFLFFLIIPVTMTLYYSFCDYNILSPAEFVGIKNYIFAFTKDPKFFKVLGVTFYYTFFSVPLRLIFALIVAMLLVRKSKLAAMYRAVYYLPSIIGGSVAVAIMWKRIFAMDGVLNSLLGLIGIETTFSWLSDLNTAIWVLIALAVWQFGSSMLIFLSSLKQIPASLYEAADIDGANKWRQFWKITFPLLTPTIFFNLVMQTINAFLAFTQCYIITQGKPLDSTLFYTVYMYQQSFEFHNTGYAAAMAWIMLVIVGAMTAFLFVTKKLWVYDGGL